MTSPPAARPNHTAAAAPAPHTTPEVWLRDADGGAARRIPHLIADRLVADSLARRVSAAGHVRLKIGVRYMPDGEPISGIPAVELSRHYRGDAATATAMRHIDRRR